MTPNDEPEKPVPPADVPGAPDRTLDPPLEGVLTEEDIREIEASGLTLSDVIRKLGLEEEG